MSADRAVAWDLGPAYERYMGRWSPFIAREFLGWLAIPAGRRWLDVGCGTGALTRTILESSKPVEVVGIDPSAGFLDHARTRTADPRAQFVTGDAQALPFDDRSFDAVVAGLSLNFVPAPALGVAEMLRVARPGGTVAAYVWDYAEGMQMIRAFWDAAIALNPGVEELDQSKRFPIANPERLFALFRSAGLTDVLTGAIEIPMDFVDFDDYWLPHLGGQGAPPTYVVGLDDAAREALRERLRATLPIAPDGSIQLTARAWAVRGKR